MGGCAHRPVRSWFVHLRVRLTKPPQIAGLAGCGLAAPAGSDGPRARPDLRQLVQVSCGWPRAGNTFDLRASAGAAAQLQSGCGRARAARRFFPRPAARISTYAAAMKHDRGGHASLTCGFARRIEREASAAPIRASRGGKNFNLCAHKLKFLPRSRGSPAADAGAARPRRKRRAEAGARPLAGAGAPRRLRRGLRLRVAAGRKAAVKGRWAGAPIDPFAYGSSTCRFALRNLHKSPGRASWGAGLALPSS